MHQAVPHQTDPAEQFDRPVRRLTLAAASEIGDLPLGAPSRAPCALLGLGGRVGPVGGYPPPPPPLQVICGSGS